MILEGESDDNIAAFMCTVVPEENAMVQPAQHRKTLQSTSCNCCWQGSVAFSTW